VKRRVPNLRGSEPLLDIVSYGRTGPRSLTRTERDYVDRTVRRAPEVVVKVSGGARTLAGVERHLAYVGRQGKLAMESDDGQVSTGKGFQSDVILDWNLDLEARARNAQRSIRAAGKPPKLVHNILFSMPPGTRPDLVLKAVRKLAAHQFALKHRYAMVLHTDEPHPHVHVVVKAVSEQGERLNIKKATLREWRREFAENLRELGVWANATERAVRGQPRASKSDGIFRAARRGQSSYMRASENEAILNAANGVEDAGKRALISTRGRVVAGWRSVSARLRSDGDHKLSREVDQFVEQMPPPLTERELLLGRLRPMEPGPQRGPPARTR
jgi:Relaxase/Mobilisation nuclease domain